MPYPTVGHAQRLNQWHTAANLIDKAYNPREPLHHTLVRTHTQTHSQLQGDATFDPQDLAQGSKLTLIASEDLFRVTL